VSRSPALSPVRFALLLAALAGAIWLATSRLALPWVVAGASMEPTLADGDRVLVDLWSYRQRGPRLGEVVLLDGPLPDEPPMLKRVAPAPPGAARRFDPLLWNGEGSELGVWVLGDADAGSLDSRSFGPVPASRIRGRVVLRYWPLSRAGPIR